jgi:hypothetical protein
LKFIQNVAELRLATARTVPPRTCRCAVGACEGWESLAEYRWDAQRMTPVGSLQDVAVPEPSLDEYHPGGTRYDAPDAPIALKFYPYNRCELWLCNACDRYLLRYTEFGGYNVDHRVRALDPAKIVD